MNRITLMLGVLGVRLRWNGLHSEELHPGLDLRWLEQHRLGDDSFTIIAVCPYLRESNGNLHESGFRKE
jgi:hypothetical protein